MKPGETYIRIGQRVEKTPANEHGWKRVDFIDENETCVVVLGGNGTDNDVSASGYAKHVVELLEQYELDDKVNVYSVVYCDEAKEADYFMPALLQKRSREQLLSKYGRKDKKPISEKEKEFAREAEKLFGANVLKPENKEISDPEYIENLFEKTLLYRICENGRKLSVDEAKKRVRKLNFVVHCHGAYVFFKLEELMQKKMAELGYLKKESEDIQKQLLCVAYAPYAPLGVSKSTMISFASVKDDNVWHQNTFHKEIKKINKFKGLKMSYFPDKLGDIFVVSSILKEDKPKSEHNFPNYITPRLELSEDGELFVRFSRNAVLGGVESSLSETPLSDVRTLVCGKGGRLENSFEECLKNGQEVYAAVVRNARIAAFYDHAK